jgi:acetyl-CoA synthetase
MSRTQTNTAQENLPFGERVILNNWDHRNIGIDAYKAMHEKTLNPEFWEGVANELEWFRKWDKTLDDSNPPFYKWFVGGQLNASYLCLDRHVKSWRKNKVAIIWEGEPVDSKGEPVEVRKLTYYDLYKNVNRLAMVLKRSFGIKRGDTVGIYMPMVPELPIAMLALSRIGATFSVVFSGFSSDSLSERMNDAEAKLLITANGFYRRGKIVNLKSIADEAVEKSPTIKNVIVFKRIEELDVPMREGRDYWWHELIEGTPENAYIEPEPLPSEFPLYILYTSGTTGKPKGIVHDTGGYMTLLHATMKWVFDIRDEDVYWCSADIGWVTGHSYIVYGPLMEGATEIMYEGAPIYPEPDRWWSIAERYGVSVFYTSPTGIRTLMKFGDQWVKKHDLSTLRLLHSVGEPINPEAWRWYFEVVGGGKCPVGSTWWMTETGGILISHLPGNALVPLKPGTNGLPIFGIDADVFNDDGKPARTGEKGYLVIKNPWPGMPLTIHKDPEKFIQTYFDKFKGIYYAGDYAIKDEDDYIWVLGRADEVIKVAGHRLGTYEIESSLVGHSAVAESAVIGVPDEIKGELPMAFVVLKQGYDGTEELRKELHNWVRKTVGPIADPGKIFFVSSLPKTRSGKIMRRVLKAVLTNQSLGDITTLEDQASVEEVKQAYERLRAELEG